MPDLYIGLMSGTSADGIDAVLVDFNHDKPKIISTYYTSYSNTLRRQILALCQEGENELQRMGELDTQLGREFAIAVNNLLSQTNISSHDVKAIGSHGQTIRHSPFPPNQFTLQIGDPNIIAAETGITTVADFRRKDVALAGQGAPLVPVFHHFLFAADDNRAIVNIGGIANVTFLLKNSTQIHGYDTGPGNALLDSWIYSHKNETHDHDGTWGAQGKVDIKLLKLLMDDDYFQLPPPKSTGRDYFNLSWLKNNLKLLQQSIETVNVQATLIELTAKSIVDAITSNMSDGEILICGGGAHNKFLMQRITELAGKHYTVASTKKLEIDPDWIEAMAFAWLAKQTLKQQPGNLPSVTGAKRAAILGGVYY